MRTVWRQQATRSDPAILAATSGHVFPNEYNAVRKYTGHSRQVREESPPGKYSQDFYNATDKIAYG
ncbi:MAG: hypothetical protein A4E42_00205 [Methanoregulaceae archaeon PtaU1.Bin222]|nr:MAG: hypothetical protein A4E42_00205 [Methanoregulaceae archaeon PtaU1.Bin222]